MYKRYIWSTLLAFGLVLSASAADLAGKNLSPGHRAATANIDAKTDAQSSVPASVQDALDRIARDLDAQTAQLGSAKAQNRAERTLRAQETMAASAALTTFLAGLGVLVALLIAFLIWRSLKASRAAAREARRAADAAQTSASEIRRVGEARARAYVGVTLEKVAFDWPDETTACPTVEIVAANSGQTPAREFVWNPTVQYIREGRRRERSLTDEWRADSGKPVAAAGLMKDSAAVADLSLAEFAGAFDPPAGDVVVRIRIAFRYRDVFDRMTEDAVYFIGLVEQAPDRRGAPAQWRGDFYPVSAPADWVEAPAETASPVEAAPENADQGTLFPAEEAPAAEPAETSAAEETETPETEPTETLSDEPLQKVEE